MLRRWRSIVTEPRFVGRTIAGFGLVITVTALTAIGSALYARDASTRREQILTVYTTDLTNAYLAQLAAEKMVAVGRGYLLTPDATALARFQAAETQLDGSLDALDRRGISARERALVAATKRSALHYRTMFDDVIAARANRGQTPAAMLRDQLLPARENLGAHLEELGEHKRQLQDEARRAARTMDTHTFAFTAALGTAGVLLSILLAWGFTRHLGQIYRREQDAAARAAHAAAAKEDLLGIVAHDLRNPLGAIILQATLIDRHTGEDRAHRHAGSIVAIATRTEAFIQKLLDAARIEAGRLSVAWSWCRIADVLGAAVETFGPMAAEKSITLDQEISRGDLGFWGDPERIGQVLSNLVGNALKFTPDGGRITIRAVESGFYTRVEVRDTGPGIASQHLPRVFERFWKADAGGRQGSGLGLYIAKGIVEKHHGRIWAESVVGVGSAFIFELPIALPPGAEAAPHTGESDRGHEADAPHEQRGELGEHPHR
jgi:signal transduction histidine kinase